MVFISSPMSREQLESVLEQVSSTRLDSSTLFMKHFEDNHSWQKVLHNESKARRKSSISSELPLRPRYPQEQLVS